MKSGSTATPVYMLLGVLIHKLTGKFYGNFLRQRVWGPAGMPTIQPINDRAIVPHRSAGYDWIDGGWLNQQWVSKTANSTADGTLYAAPDDFINWDRALDTYKVLPKELQQEAWTPVRLKDGREMRYGYGWEIHRRFGRRSLGHNGSWQGFQTDYLRLPDDRLSVVVFENCSSGSPVNIVEGIVALVSPKMSLSKHPANPGSGSEAKRAESFFRSLFAGKSPAANTLGPKMKFTESETGYFQGLAEGRGQLLRTEEVDRWQDGGITRAAFRLVFRDSILVFELDQDSDGKYVGVSSYG